MEQTTAQLGVRDKFCDVHKDEEITLYCKGCKILVCNECICNQHDGHHFCLIKNAANDLRKSLPTLAEDARSEYLETLQKKQNEITCLTSEFETAIDSLAEKVNNRMEELKAKFDELGNQLLDTISTMKENHLVDIRKVEETVNVCLERLSGCLHSYTEKLESPFDIEIVQLSMDLNSALDSIKETNLEIPILKIPDFVSGETSEKMLYSVFGCIHDEDLQDANKASDCEIPEEIIERQLKISSLFQYCDSSSVRCILPNGDNIWIASHNDTSIQLVTRSGELKRSFSLEVKIYNIDTTSDGSLLVVPNRAQQVWKIDLSGNCSDFINMEPFYPLGLYVSRSGHVYTGMVDGRPYNVDSGNTRAVLRLSPSGSIEQRYEFDDKKEHLFIRPQRIVENSLGDVIVLDRTSHREGRLVCVMQNGSRRFVYNGTQCKEMQNPFHPGDLCCLGNDNLVVSDGNNHILHVLNADGVLLNYLNPKTDQYPPAVSALAFHSEEHLLIGTSKGMVYVLEYTD